MGVALSVLAAVLFGAALLNQSPAPAVGDRTAASDLPTQKPRRAATGEYRTPTGPIMARSAPTMVRIPSLDVSSPVVRLGLKDDNTMAVPKSAEPTGWFGQSPTPGSLGPAVLAGHVTWQREPAVFFKLRKIRKGARIEIDRRDGSTAIFRVTSVGQYAKSAFPTEKVYGSTDRAALRLITCGGVFDGETSRYSDNVVVLAELTGGDGSAASPTGM